MAAEADGEPARFQNRHLAPWRFGGPVMPAQASIQ
jgi:hypothetical protein